MWDINHNRFDEQYTNINTSWLGKKTSQRDGKIKRLSLIKYLAKDINQIIRDILNIELKPTKINSWTSKRS